MERDRSTASLRILLVSEHASAQFGGEAILALHYFRALRARGIDVRLITHARSEPELRKRFGADSERIHFVPDTRTQRLMVRVGKNLPASVSHFSAGWISRLITQLSARRMARRLIRQWNIDVVHQPMPVSPRESSLLYGLGAPVIIGPMNGAMSFPPGFRHLESRAARAFIQAGRFASGFANRLMPGKLHAETLLVANQRTREALPSGLRGKIIEMVENGVEASLWLRREQERSAEDRPVRFVFAGRLIRLKAVDLLLEAFCSAVDQAAMHLTIIGDGPERPALERQVRDLGLGSRVTFAGWLTQAQCASLLRRADVFVLPSVHECGGAVVLEAMAVGLPVVAARWGGPADYVDESCGILVDPTSPEHFVQELSEAMLSLARNPSLRARLGQNGRHRALSEFDWDRKVERILDIYADTVAQSRRRPDQPVLMVID